MASLVIHSSPILKAFEVHVLCLMYRTTMLTTTLILVVMPHRTGIDVLLFTAQKSSPWSEVERGLEWQSSMVEGQMEMKGFVYCFGFFTKTDNSWNSIAWEIKTKCDYTFYKAANVTSTCCPLPHTKNQVGHIRWKLSYRRTKDAAFCCCSCKLGPSHTHCFVRQPAEYNIREACLLFLRLLICVQRFRGPQL